MLHIEFPAHSFQIKVIHQQTCIWDLVRKKWVKLTPEEWVRQNFICYLIQIKNIPPSLLAVEKVIVGSKLRHRCDIVVYKNHQPWMIVECKEMQTGLTDEVVYQILRYNMFLPVEYLVITNGTHSLAWQRTENGLTVLTDLPAWNGAK
jgi:hypothetical protein